MWFPSKAFEVLKIAAEACETLRVENAVLQAQLEAAKSELISIKANSDWLRMRFNELIAENKGLIEKAYSIRLPVPVLERAPKVPADIFSKAIFEHQDDLEQGYGA